MTDYGDAGPPLTKAEQALYQWILDKTDWSDQPGSRSTIRHDEFCAILKLAIRVRILELRLFPDRLPRSDL